MTISASQSASTAAISPNLLSKSDVMKLLGVSDRTIEKMVAAGDFPPPIRLGKCARWAEAAVVAWLNEKVAKQLRWQPRRRVGRPAVAA